MEGLEMWRATLWPVTDSKSNAPLETAWSIASWLFLCDIPILPQAFLSSFNQSEHGKISSRILDPGIISFLPPKSLENSIHTLFRNSLLGKKEKPSYGFFLIKETKWEGQIALRTFYRPGSAGNISSLKNVWQVTGTIYWRFLRDKPRIAKGIFSERLHGLTWFSWEQLGLIRNNWQLVLVTSEYLLTSSSMQNTDWFRLDTSFQFSCPVPIPSFHLNASISCLMSLMNRGSWDGNTLDAPPNYHPNHEGWRKCGLLIKRKQSRTILCSL